MKPAPQTVDKLDTGSYAFRYSPRSFTYRG